MRTALGIVIPALALVGLVYVRLNYDRVFREAKPWRRRPLSHQEGLYAIYFGTAICLLLLVVGIAKAI